MYIDYATWSEKEFSLKSLYLDLSNPRLNYADVILTQPGIIGFLVENEAVYELAKEISEKGFFVGESPIICEEKNKKVVLEGNRRTAALKILQNPDKYLTKKKAATLKENIRVNKIDIDKKIRCFIAPNRFAANPIIYNRHKGDSLKKWKTGNQYAFIAEMVYRDGLSLKDISDSLGLSTKEAIEPLKALNVFVEGKKILEKEGISLTAKEFEFTNLERFFKYEDGRKFLGIDFDDETGDLLINIPREEFEKRCGFIFKEIISTTAFSRKFGNKQQMDNYISEINKKTEFDFTVEITNKKTRSVSTDNREKNETLKNEVPVEKPKRTSNLGNLYYIEPTETLDFQDEKIDTLFFELRTLFKSKAYSFAILLRTYLEQILYLYLTKKKLIDNLGDKGKVKKEENNLKKIETLEMYLRKVNNLDGNLDKKQVMSILKFNANAEFDGTGLKSMLDFTITHVLTNLFDGTEFRNQKNYLNSVKEDLDLAVHNHSFIIDKTVNIRAWKTLYKFFKALENDLSLNSEDDINEI